MVRNKYITTKYQDTCKIPEYFFFFAFIIGSAWPVLFISPSLSLFPSRLLEKLKACLIFLDASTINTRKLIKKS